MLKDGYYAADSTANKILLARKYTHVIAAIATRQKINLRQAMDVFYKSYTYQEMREGISDMHCRSDKYLAEEIEMEAKYDFRNIQTAQQGCENRE